MKKIHPADAADFAALQHATAFKVHYRASPTETMDESFATLAQARAWSDELSRTRCRGGRQPIIYGLCGQRYIFVPDSFKQ